MHYHPERPFMLSCLTKTMKPVFPLILLISALPLLLPMATHAADVPKLQIAPRLASAQRPLTLVQLTDLALRQNPKTQLAWAAIRSSEAGVELAK
ncbi:MAG: hypothetical protein P8173_16505, partial [Gammaproteobacteria bacterium]